VHSKVTLRPQSGHIRIQWTFDKALTDSIAYLLYVEYERTILISRALSLSISKMDTVQIFCVLRNLSAICRSLYFRSAVGFYFQVWHDHNKHRFAQREVHIGSPPFSNPSHTEVSTSIPVESPVHPCYTNIFETQLLRLGLQQSTTAGSD
jgi:hypothetical protein